MALDHQQGMKQGTPSIGGTWSMAGNYNILGFREAKVLEEVVPPGRLERPTHGLGNRCSIRLSYEGKCQLHAWSMVRMP